MYDEYSVNRRPALPKSASIVGKILNYLLYNCGDIVKRIWFMEAYASQRGLILGIKDFATKHKWDIEIVVSHRVPRYELLEVADISLIEPKDLEERLAFIIEKIGQYQIDLIHIVKDSEWFEAHREQIEATGAHLVTGSTDVKWLHCAEEKDLYTEYMNSLNLPVVPAVTIPTWDLLQETLDNPPFSKPLCIKPVRGMYGYGFWRFQEGISSAELLFNPEKREISPSLYLELMKRDTRAFIPQLLMPYFPGTERSVDIIAKDGQVVAAIGRVKQEGGKQLLEKGGEAIDLAIASAKAMHADGIVNVQTKDDASGKPYLLEINMRPSTGFAYTSFSGVNLAGLFVALHLGLMSDIEIAEDVQTQFQPQAIDIV